MEWDTKSRGKLQLKSGGHCGRKSKEANPLQRLRAREQTHCTKKQKYPQGCSAVRAVRDGPELSRVAKHSVNLARGRGPVNMGSSKQADVAK